MKSRKILLVDDEEIVRTAISQTLMMADDWEILTARDGGAALELLNQHHVDLIISDHAMPEMTGLELLQEVKKTYPDTVRILLTARSNKETILHAINQSEVYRFLTKPLSKDDLVEAVREGLQAKDDHFRKLKNVKYQLHKANFETAMALAEAIELKDPYTKGHCSRVRDYSLQIAKHLNLSTPDIYHLTYGSLLHDCGKIGVKEHILLFDGPLREEDRIIMQRHSIMGFEITNRIEHLKTASFFIRQHHERWDGKGYPDGLAAEAIHVCARIIAIADAFDAMTSDRPYRRGMDTAKARQILIDNKGVQFDPDIVDVFVRIVDENPSLDMVRESQSSCPTILLVDDEQHVSKAISRMLFDENYQIITAVNGVEALEALKHNEVDLIISDQRMPEMTGVEFLKKARILRPAVIRVMLTGYSDFTDLMEAINEAGIYKFILKPWDEIELKTTIKHALEWRQTYAATYSSALWNDTLR